MANAKKPATTTKKPATKAKTTTTVKSKPAAARKATALKSTAATKAPVKRAAAAKPASKSAPATKAAAQRSAFMTTQPTRETGYWLVFSLLILALGVWVLTLTIKINDIYDQIEVSNNAINSEMIQKPAADAKPAPKAE